MNQQVSEHGSLFLNFLILRTYTDQKVATRFWDGCLSISSVVHTEDITHEQFHKKEEAAMLRQMS